MVLSFHKYWNFNDQKSVEHIIKTRDQYNVPAWIGETGENSNVWLTEEISLLEKNNLGWALWPLKKMGNNNPIEIPSNLNYDDVTNYLNTGKQKPKESNVYSGTLEMAIHAKLENAIIHRDVIDAIFRQPFTTATKPFKANKVTNGTIINAVDYDLGRNGFAYFDTDTADYHTSGKPGIGNHGRIYRNDGVDISKDSTAYNSFYVDHIETTEWTQYTIQAKTAGVYSVKLKVAAATDDAKLSLHINGADQAKEVTIPNTGGLKTWQVITVKDIRLKAGTNKVRVYANKGGYNLHWLQFWKDK